MCQFLTPYATCTLFGHSVTRTPTGCSREHRAKALAVRPDTSGGCGALLVDASRTSRIRSAPPATTSGSRYAGGPSQRSRRTSTKRGPAPLLKESLAREDPRPLRGERRRAAPRRVREGRRDPARGVAGSSG
ncbi:hypothetical protein DL768_001561 [Monosporascus sp. mg162]|nr:hypothetical protein DL768_001561 [Monosporascus sp. mg162]